MRSIATLLAASLAGTLLLCTAHVQAKEELVLNLNPTGVFKPTQQMIDALNDNGLINVYPRPEINLPAGAKRNMTEYIPNADQPELVIIKDKRGKCVRRVEYSRSSTRKISKELRFYDCSKGKGKKKQKWIGTVDLGHTWVMSKVKSVKVERPRFNSTALDAVGLTLPHYFKWAVEIDRTLVRNRFTKFTVKRNWNTTIESSLRFKRSTFTSKIKAKEEFHRVEAELLEF